MTTGTIDATAPGTEGAQPSMSQVQQDQEIIQLFAGKSEYDIRRMVSEQPELAGKLDRLAELIETEANRSQSQQGQDDSTLQQQQQENASQAQLEQGVELDDKEVSVNIRPSVLGSYAKNRSLSEAITELVKGKGEADKTIAFFKEHKVPLLEKTNAALSTENQSLKKALEDWKKKAQQPQLAPQAQGQGAALEIPNLPDDLDFLDPDHQKVISTTLKASAETIKALKNEIASLRNPQPQSQQPDAQPAPQAQSVPSDVDREFAEIRMIQAHPDFTGVLATKTDVAELDRQYSQFVATMAQVMGVNQVYQPNGAYTPEALQVLTEYDAQTSPMGKMIRERLNAFNIKPPEELDTLRKIYQIRSTRLNRLQRDVSGNVIPINYEEAARYYLTTTGAAPKPQPQSQSAMDQHAARARAEERREQFPREPRASDGAQPSDASAQEMQEFNRLVNKRRDLFTDAERLQMKDYLRRLAGMNDAEIESWFRPIRA